MKKTIRSLAMLALSAVTLCGCLSKTTYDEFHTAAGKVETISYTKATFKGKYDTEDNLNIKFVKGTSFGISTWKVDDASMDTAKATSWAAIFDIIAVLRPSAVDNSDKYEYYCGGGFKVVNNETSTPTTWQWNEYGYITAVNGVENDNKSVNYTISWTK